VTILVLLMPRTHLPSTVPENVQEIIKYINDYTLYSTLYDHCVFCMLVTYGLLMKYKSSN